MSSMIRSALSSVHRPLAIASLNCLWRFMRSFTPTRLWVPLVSDYSHPVSYPVTLLNLTAVFATPHWLPAILTRLFNCVWKSLPVMSHVSSSPRLELCHTLVAVPDDHVWNISHCRTCSQSALYKLQDYRSKCTPGLPCRPHDNTHNDHR